MSELVNLGTIVASQGLKGEVRVNFELGEVSLIDDLEAATLEDRQGNRQTVTVKTLRMKGKQIIISFNEFGDRTQADKLIGYSLYVARNQLNKLAAEEFWISQLVGLDVFTTEGNPVGTVSGIITGATATIEIKPVKTQTDQDETKSILVPFVKELVPVVDLKGKKIEVIDLPGLLEPQ